MAVVIPPRYAYIAQAVAYPKEEWTWRGIVDPSIFANTNASIIVGGDNAGSGYVYNIYGTPTPTHADSGLRWHGFSWYKTGNDGVFIAFGDNGDERIAPDVHKLQIILYGTVYVAFWSGTQYVTHNQDLVNKLNTLSMGDKLDMYMGALPDLEIEYDFNIERGVDGC